MSSRVKPGDLVRNLNSESGLLGIFVRWVTFDKDTNPYTCPEVLWFDGRLSTIQYSLLGYVNDCDN